MPAIPEQCTLYLKLSKYSDITSHSQTLRGRTICLCSCQPPSSFSRHLPLLTHFLQGLLHGFEDFFIILLPVHVGLGVCPLEPLRLTDLSVRILINLRHHVQ